MMATLQRWFGRFKSVTYESQDFERTLIDAQRRDMLMLDARLDALERKHNVRRPAIKEKHIPDA